MNPVKVAEGLGKDLSYQAGIVDPVDRSEPYA